MRKRPQHAKTERAGLLAVETACNALDLIWRDLLQEDVGVDGTIEIAMGDFPSGKLVAAQVKSGASYIRAETDTSFKFYPKAGDLEYWSQLSIPLFLFVHDPATGTVFWVDITSHVQERAADPLGAAYIEFNKANTIDKAFEAYLRSKFDLAAYEDAEFEQVRAELEAIVHTDGSGDAAVTVSALDLFIEGLWGLCSKVQFHSSMLADMIRKDVRDRGTDIFVRYTFSRAALYPFFTQYFNVLTRHHLALIDAADVNHSLYAKLEFPTFVAPLTTNGRRFVEFLRDAGDDRVHDNRFFTQSLIPHEQIEIYKSFEMQGDRAVFGPCTDVLAISFNPHLDYYKLDHWRLVEAGKPFERAASQTIFYFELIEYLERTLEGMPKDNVVLRHLELPLTPLICWLEDWYEEPRPFPAAALGGKSNVETFGFYDEMTSIMATAGTMSFTEPPLLRLPIRRLASGEVLNLEGPAPE